MKLSETLEQMAKKGNSLYVFPLCSFFKGVFIHLDLICTCSLSVYKSQFLILVKLKCFIFQAHHPRSWIGLYPNTLILKGLSNTLTSEGPYERNIKEHQRQTQIMGRGAVRLAEFAAVCCICVTPFKPYLGQC